MANSNLGTTSYQAGREGDFTKLSQQIGTNIQKISQNGIYTTGYNEEISIVYKYVFWII